MNFENVWKWLDAVDQDHLDQLDQWGVPSLQRIILRGSDTVPYGSDGETYQQYNGRRNAEVASILENLPPAGILLRNGSIRSTSKNPMPFAQDANNENHPQSLLPGFSKDLAQTLENEEHSQPQRPSFPTISKMTSQRRDAPPSGLQVSGRERNSESTNPKRLPTFAEHAHLRGISGTLHSKPVIHAVVTDTVAIDCQGARVVGGPCRKMLQNVSNMEVQLRRNTTNGDEALHRSNAIRRPSKVRAVSNARPET